MYIRLWDDFIILNLEFKWNYDKVLFVFFDKCFVGVVIIINLIRVFKKSYFVLIR